MIQETASEFIAPKEHGMTSSTLINVFDPTIFPTVLMALILVYCFIVKQMKPTPLKDSMMCRGIGHTIATLSGLSFIKAAYLLFVFTSEALVGSGFDTTRFVSMLLIIFIDLVLVGVSFPFLPKSIGRFGKYIVYAFVILSTQLLGSIMISYAMGAILPTTYEFAVHILYRVAFSFAVALMTIAFQKGDVPAFSDLVQ